MGLHCLLETRDVYATDANAAWHKEARQRFNTLLLSEEPAGKDTRSTTDTSTPRIRVSTLDDVGIESESINE